jgi:hypothetical protein
MLEAKDTSFSPEQLEAAIGKVTALQDAAQAAGLPVDTPAPVIETAAEQAGEPDGEAEEPAEETVQEAAPDAPAETVEKTPEPDLDARILQALERRDNEHRQRMQALESREKQFEQQISQLRQVEERATKAERAIQMFRYNPVGAMKEMGLGEDAMNDFAHLIFGATMGDKAPADVKARLQVGQTDAKVAQLEAEIAAFRAEQQRREQETAYQSYVANYRSGIDARIATADQKAFPHLHRYAQADKAQLLDTVMETAIQMAQASGRDPSHEEVLQAVESRMAKLLGPVLKSVTAPSTPPAPAPKTLKSTHTQKTRPSPPREEDESAALQRAIHAAEQRLFNS